LKLEKINKENTHFLNKPIQSARHNDSTSSSSLLVMPKMKSINSKLPQNRKNFKKNDDGSYILVANHNDTNMNTNSQKELGPLQEESKTKTQNLANELRSINQSCL
jgi:hypothetical protein